MAFRSTVEVSGHKIDVRLPETAREMLDYLAFVAPRHDHSAAHGGSYTQSVEHVIQWLDRYVEDGGDWVDRHLEIVEAFKLAGKISDAASIPDDLLDELRDFAQIHGRGGCDCPACSDPEAMEQADEETARYIRSKCKFSDVSSQAVQIAASTRPAREGSLLDAPWYLYQIDQAISTGRYRGRQQKERRENQQQKMRKALGAKR